MKKEREREREREEEEREVEEEEDGNVGWDERISKRIFVFSDRSVLIRGINIISSLSNDGRFVLTGFICYFVINKFHLIDPVILVEDPSVRLFLLILYDAGLCGILKQIVKRPRPSFGFKRLNGEIFLLSDIYSFPSGHASRAALLACYVSKFHTSSSTLVNLIGTWAASVCFSRIALGRHFITDVGIGALLGAANLYIGVNFVLPFAISTLKTLLSS
jgi:membrane-associated phospholipid phosphatase